MVAKNLREKYRPATDTAIQNWFQNRRAKAKQQKRQEEFEKKQADANEKQPISDSHHKAREDGHEQTPTEKRETSATPTRERPESRDTASVPKTVSHDILGTGSTARETDSTPKFGGSLKCESEGSRESSCPETSSNGCEDAAASWSGGTVPEIEIGVEEQQPRIQSAIQLDHVDYLPQKAPAIDERFLHQLSSSPFSQSLLTVAPTQFQPQTLSDEQQESYTSAHTDEATPPPQSCQIRPSANGGSFYTPQAERRGGLAARRKRPRPAAIGTNISRPFISQSSISPPRRSSSWGTCLSPSISKSAQNLLPDMSPKFSGIRKSSVSPRSPLTLPPSVEATSNAFSSTDLALPPPTTTSIGPATPMTPDDLQYLLPPTPNDTQYCLSPADDMSYTHMFRTSHMGNHGDSTFKPSANLLAMPNMCYPNSTAPMSASANQSTFGDCFLPGPIGPVISDYGTDGVSPPSYENGANLSEVPMSTYLSPRIYETQYSNAEESEYWNSASPSSSQDSHKGLDSSQSSYTPEFLIQEFPQQKETLAGAAQQLKSPTPRFYTFTNQTPHDF